MRSDLPDNEQPISHRILEEQNVQDFSRLLGEVQNQDVSHKTAVLSHEIVAYFSDEKQ